MSEHLILHFDLHDLSHFFKSKNDDNTIIQYSKSGLSYIQRQIISQEILPANGKYHFKVGCPIIQNNAVNIGIVTELGKNQILCQSNQTIFYCGYDGKLFTKGQMSQTLQGKSIVTDDIIRVELDIAEKTIEFYLNDKLQFKTELQQHFLNQKIYAKVDLQEDEDMVQFL